MEEILLGFALLNILVISVPGLIRTIINPGIENHHFGLGTSRLLTIIFQAA